MRTVAVTLLLLTLAALPLCAQNVCRPPDNSNEANTLAAMSVPIAFAPLDAPRPARAGAVQVALEGTYIPQIDPVTRTPTICRPGKGPEQTQLLGAFPRPRVLIGLPGGMLFEGAWVPPIRLNGVKANLGSAALSRGFPIGRGSAVFGVRAHATFGVVNAPITCPADQLANPASECFQGTESDDHYHPNIFGVEGTLGWTMAGGQLHPYFGGGVNVLHPRFRVNFVNRFGDLDNTLVEVNLTRGVVFGGLAWRVAPGWGVSAEIYAQPADAVTGRLALGYAIR